MLSHYSDGTEWLQQRTYGPQSLKYLLSGPLEKSLLTPELELWQYLTLKSFAYIISFDPIWSVKWSFPFYR